MKTTMTQEEFDERLHAEVGRMTASTILSYGDVYTILAEELNNTIIEKWENEQTVKQAEIESIEADGPEEGDITTTDHKVWYQYGKTWLYGDPCDVKAKMEQEKFWPNCWFISDHGNAHLIYLGN